MVGKLVGCTSRGGGAWTGAGLCRSLGCLCCMDTQPDVRWVASRLTGRMLLPRAMLLGFATPRMH